MLVKDDSRGSGCRPTTRGKVEQSQHEMFDTLSTHKVPFCFQMEFLMAMLLYLLAGMLCVVAYQHQDSRLLTTGPLGKVREQLSRVGVPS